MATKNGQIKSTSNQDASALIYAVDQTQAILEMLKGIK
jgi:hypothetical protein